MFSKQDKASKLEQELACEKEKTARLRTEKKELNSKNKDLEETLNQKKVENDKLSLENQSLKREVVQELKNNSAFAQQWDRAHEVFHQELNMLRAALEESNAKNDRLEATLLRHQEAEEHNIQLQKENDQLKHAFFNIQKKVTQLNHLLPPNPSDGQ